nr:hypothetical protein [Pedobacter sp. ASV19]
MRALSDLLYEKNAVAIIATHSPVVLQEVPSSCCWRLRRFGTNSQANRLSVESFGENVGTLTQEVFGLEVEKSGYHRVISEVVAVIDTYRDVLKKFDNQLGYEAKAIVRALLAIKDQNDQ